jgi:predicted ATPase
VLVDALLRSCPNLRIIATSRHVLGVTGEVTVTIPPMTVVNLGGELAGQVGAPADAPPTLVVQPGVSTSNPDSIIRTLARLT